MESIHTSPLICCHLSSENLIFRLFLNFIYLSFYKRRFKYHFLLKEIWTLKSICHTARKYIIRRLVAFNPRSLLRDETQYLPPNCYFSRFCTPGFQFAGALKRLHLLFMIPLRLTKLLFLLHPPVSQSTKFNFGCEQFSETLRPNLFLFYFF